MGGCASPAASLALACPWAGAPSAQATRRKPHCLHKRTRTLGWAIVELYLGSVIQIAALLALCTVACALLGTLLPTLRRSWALLSLLRLACRSLRCPYLPGYRRPGFLWLRRQFFDYDVCYRGLASRVPK